jgi:hypothetical protein
MSRVNQIPNPIALLGNENVRFFIFSRPPILPPGAAGARMRPPAGKTPKKASPVQSLLDGVAD